jgi:hypothetical protein
MSGPKCNAAGLAAIWLGDSEYQRATASDVDHFLDDYRRIRKLVGRALGETLGPPDPAFLRRLTGIAQALLVEARRAGRCRNPSSTALDNGEAAGRKIGIRTASTLSTLLALAVDGEAYTPALVEALETLVALLLGETVAHDRLDEVVDALVPRLRSRAHLVAEALDEQQTTAAPGRKIP